MIEESVSIGLVEPVGDGECVLLICRAVCPFKAFAEDCRIDFCENVVADRNLPAIEGPEVDLVVLTSQFAKPGKSGMRRFCHAPLDVKLEDRLRRRGPHFGESQFGVLAASQVARTKVLDRRTGKVGWPMLDEIVQKLIPRLQLVPLEIAFREGETMIDPDQGRAEIEQSFAEPLKKSLAAPVDGAAVGLPGADFRGRETIFTQIDLQGGSAMVGLAPSGIVNPDVTGEFHDPETPFPVAVLEEVSWKCFTPARPMFLSMPVNTN